MITSLLDLDLYKLTVAQVIFQHFQNVHVKYRLTVRNGEKIGYWKYVYYHSYERNLVALKELSLSATEANYLRGLGLFTEDFINFLCDKPMSGVQISREYQDDTFLTPVPQVEGLWHKAMLFEIFCLSIGNEMFSIEYCNRNQISMSAVLDTARERLVEKIQRIKKYSNENRAALQITEFGTRRRLSKVWQDSVVSSLVANDVINGTSNVQFAKEYGIKPLGTFGHEFVMGLQGVFRIQDSQKKAFDIWLNHWNGKLKIALDDTFGTDKFLRDFDENFAKAYDGLRHDSGDWKEWTEQRLDMYWSYGINPETKTLFYSDGLDVDTIFAIHSQYKDKAKLAFGVGTNLTNDSFIPVPQVVMKIIESNGQPVCKLSNNPAKASCTDPEYLAYVKHVAAKY